MTWVAASLTLWVAFGQITTGLALLLGALLLSGFILSMAPAPVEHIIWRRVPSLPGQFSQLIRKEFRHVLSTLDFYIAVLLSIGTAAVRVSGVVMPQYGLMILTVLLVLSLSNYTMSLFALDGSSGMSRYRLLPLPGSRVLIAKGIAVILATLPLLGPLQLAAGLAAVLTALAIGHHASIRNQRFGRRWRFSPGTQFLPQGLLQTAGIASSASLVFFYGPWLLVPFFAAWGCSAWLYGRSFDAPAAT